MSTTRQADTSSSPLRGLLLFLIIKVRLHAFFSLIVVSVLTGLAAAHAAGLRPVKVNAVLDPRTGLDDAVALVRDSGDAIAMLDDIRIAQVIENYVAAERYTAAADYGRYDGDVFFVDATILEMDLEGVASAGWRAHIGGALTVVALDCRHSELMDADTLQRLGPIIAGQLDS